MKLLLQINTPKEEYNSNNNRSYIVACGPNTLAITQYFICIEKRLICVPVTYSFYNVFDLLIKFINMQNYYIII